ncbi:APC family permease [Nocardioides jishulii]|uniref:APC family permease n=1 Tax=Nocardioides jishulii TaxID=2575440 RepID=UPI001C3100F3|nr:amino acid permease [Nocardioides jishulii]
MTEKTADGDEPVKLNRTITTSLLFFYVLGDVLGSGVYVLIGSVAGAVGGAFWIAFAVGVSVAAITGLAYAELATKYPHAAGAALYVNRAFHNRTLAFLVMVAFLSASFAAAGSLSVGFASYFLQVWDAPPALLVSLAFFALLGLINYIGITESVWITMLMTFVEIAGLVLVLIIGIWYVVQRDPDFSRLVQFETTTNPIWAIVGGVALAFFAMTGFENVVNVAEETVDPHRAFPRALVGGMIAAGLIYVAVAVVASLVVGAAKLSTSDVALLEVVKADVVPLPVTLMTTLFAVIACVAITNTTLVAAVTEPRVLYGMANEDVVPPIFARLHRRSPWGGPALLLRRGRRSPRDRDPGGPGRRRHQPHRAPGDGDGGAPPLHLLPGHPGHAQAHRLRRLGPYVPRATVAPGTRAPRERPGACLRRGQRPHVAALVPRPPGRGRSPPRGGDVLPAPPSPGGGCGRGRGQLTGPSHPRARQGPPRHPEHPG